MKRIVIIAVLLSSSILSMSAQTSKWSIDPTHSHVQFDVAHMVISEITGQFHEFEGTIMANKADFSDAKIEFSIDVSSIDTDDADRDGHLKSVDFFDVAKYPTITFKSESMKKVGKNLYKLAGTFTLHGVSKPITLDVKYGGTVVDPFGNTKAGFKITGVVDRTEFGLIYNSPMDSGGLMIGEEVTITCNVELILSK